MDCTSPRVSVIDVDVSERRNNQGENKINSRRDDQLHNDRQRKRILWKLFPWMMEYLKKFSGLHENRPNRLSWSEHFWSFFGCLISTTLVAILHYQIFEK